MINISNSELEPVKPAPQNMIIIDNDSFYEADSSIEKHSKEIFNSGFFLAHPESSPSRLSSLKYEWVNNDWGIISLHEGASSELQPIFERYGMDVPESLQIGFHYLSDGAVTPEDAVQAAKINEIPYSEPTAQEVIVRFNSTRIRLTMQVDANDEVTMMKRGEFLNSQNDSTQKTLGGGAVKYSGVISKDISEQGNVAERSMQFIDESKLSQVEVALLKDVFDYLNSNTDDEAMQRVPMSAIHRQGYLEPIPQPEPQYFNWQV